MKVIAIDTVTESCSAALLLDRQCLVRTSIARNRHSAMILPMLESLLAQAGVCLGSMDAIAFDRGPGSFTGVRIGMGVAQGLAFSADLPLCGVSSLSALAAAAPHDTILSAIDARMGQVYWALVDRKNVFSETPDERLDNPADISIDNAAVHGVGSGWDAYSTEMAACAGNVGVHWTPDCFPQAEWIGKIAVEYLRSGGGRSPDHVIPVYLRHKVTS